VRLLDLFCGAGGAAVGYSRAGFTEIVGVDHKPQPRYPFEFVQADALEYLADHGREFDAIHASPPCQAYSVANNIHSRTDHPDLVDETRAALERIGKPWVIENVYGSPLIYPALVCGLALGLNVKRHRYFESSVFLFSTTCPPGHKGNWILVFGNSVLERGTKIGVAKGGGPAIKRKHIATHHAHAAMGINWMSRKELSQAIPPAYTEFVGRQLIQSLGRPTNA